MAAPKVVIVGAGIVGTSLADELTARGWTDVTVLDRGPLFATGGSTSHAPGLVFATNPSKTMTELASYTIEKFSSLEHPDGWCFNPLGGLELATTPERWEDLHRKAGWAAARGVEHRLVDAAECAAMYPLIDRDLVLGGLHTPNDGLAKAMRAVEAQAARAMSRGAVFRGEQEVIDIVEANGEVRGVRTTTGVVDADIVVCCTGFWGREFGRRVGLTIPLVPMAHQYAITTAIDSRRGVNSALAEASLPILRHQDHDLYYREHGDRIGIGYYGHRPMPSDVGNLDYETKISLDEMPSKLMFTPDDFDDAWQHTVALLPELGNGKVEEGFNGIFSFTPDGHSIMGEHRDLAGFWVAEAVWVTHSAGVAKTMAEWMIDGTPGIDVHETDLYRFEDEALRDDVILATSSQSFVEVYDIVHPHDQRKAPRNVRTSPFHDREVNLGAEFWESGLWERPAWFEANRPLLEQKVADGLQIPQRDPWAARHWSPIAVAEAAHTRSHVAVYDMTPLTRFELSGPGARALLQQLTTNNMDKSVGSVTYTLMLDDKGGVRSDLTVARLTDNLFQVGANGPLDFDWITRHLPADGSVTLRDITAATCCLGLWGPLARDVLAPLTPADLTNDGLRYFRAMTTTVGAVPVTLMRVSYVGELGWEIYTSAANGRALWDAVMAAGEPHGIIAAGRIAFNSLRIEKGYRSAGTDMTIEHTPAAAGLDFAVRMSKDDFLGKSALAERGAPSRLRTLRFTDHAAVVLGKEPVAVNGAVVGYITSAGWSATVGACLAYAWLPTDLADGSQVEISYQTTQYTAVVTSDPVVDPEMARIRK
ncbi:MAG: sarcosine dehydrogenase [Gordonia sp.]|uniref:GcvT family protein n=1 Tax=Gordonia sp. (in: high G+C Gram-positive bacteria) TaxID=84139 RepID=UPI000C479140|nr:FAD-dependent oxidoreductase [Gordonia sp. (in: high G+C Gram-positive bacteria)]MAU84861.1 sarcosine dehydrogenase [Gordonia sp. (in: high G+C Gram-positive bacteria)]